MSEPTLLTHSAIPSDRVRVANERMVRVDGEFVLYWMTACRLTRFNFALQRAVEWANHCGQPLLVLEAVVSPVIMTVLLVRVSGVALLERSQVRTKPGYREYIARTSPFVPWFPRNVAPEEL